MYDIPFIFYDHNRSGVADVEQRHWNDESWRWCKGEQRRNNDATLVSTRTSQIRERWRVDD